MIAMFTSIWIALSALASDGGHLKGYRIIFTTPDEFVSALFSPQPVRPPEKAPSSEVAAKAKSRMQKYFVIKSKKIEGQSVVIEVEPNLPLVGTAFSESTQLELTFELMDHGVDTFVYALSIKSKNTQKVSTMMTIKPHAMGSLLTLELLSEGTITNGFAKLATNLGFLAATTVEAENIARKENPIQ